jgi:hypothetical protein
LKIRGMTSTDLNAKIAMPRLSRSEDMPMLIWLLLSFGLIALEAPVAGASASSRATAPAIPAGYTVRQARDFGVACNGAKDDTIALQNALNGLNDRQALQLPAGTCLTSKQLVLSGKSNVAVIGAGKDSTILQATDPLHSSFIVNFGSNVRLGGFQVYSPNTGGMKRTSDPNSKGFLVKNSSGVVLDGIKAREVLGAGVLFNGVRDSKILNSEVVKSLADAFHITGGSENVVAQGNLAEGAGDDGFASIGYIDGINRNIQFLDNVVRDGWWGSGVSFEGTNGGKAYRNKVYRSGVAGIRISSQRNWKTGPSDNLDLEDNYLEGCVTRAKTGHGSVMIYSNFMNIGPNITLARTTIKNPASGPAFRAFGGPKVGATVSAKVEGTTLSGVSNPFNIGANADISNAGRRMLSHAERRAGND